MSAVTWHAAGTKILTNTDGTVTWETAGVTGSTLTQAEKNAALNMGFTERATDANVREYIDSYTSISKVANWNTMSMSTAVGAMADIAYVGASFDGRYIYYVPSTADTFVRFDTQGTFTT